MRDWNPVCNTAQTWENRCFYLTYEGLKPDEPKPLEFDHKRFYLTYEGLKLCFCFNRKGNCFCFYLTYEGLKPKRITIIRILSSVRFYLTYEGLKLAFVNFFSATVASFYLTYEGLKRWCTRRRGTGACWVSILPMRDWNMAVQQLF